VFVEIVCGVIEQQMEFLHLTQKLHYRAKKWNWCILPKNYIIGLKSKPLCTHHLPFIMAAINQLTHSFGQAAQHDTLLHPKYAYDLNWKFRL
jgi:hypothetical protein